MPIPTLLFEASIDKVEVSKANPFTPPVSATLVSTEKVRALALSVGIAFKVSVSVVASPRVVLPMIDRLPVNVPLPVVPASIRVNKVFVPSLKLKVPPSAIPMFAVVSLK